MKSINIIGCGNVGITLGHLIHLNKSFTIKNLMDSCATNAKRAQSIIGSGCPINDIALLSYSDIYLITTPDNAIEKTFNAITNHLKPTKDTIFIHCSGAKPATIMTSTSFNNLAMCIHPIRSFSKADISADSLAGTYCGIDGDTAAIKLLTPFLKQIEAIPFSVDSNNKAIYHAASVFACNYLTSLLEIALKSYEKAGIPQEVAKNIMQPLINGTVENIINTSTHEALTGPIARGDHEVVNDQLAKLANWDKDIAELYINLGKITVELSNKKGAAKKSDLDTISEFFSQNK